MTRDDPNFDPELDLMFGLTDEELDQRFIDAVRIAKEISRIKGCPTSEWDEERRETYLLYPDGHREYFVTVDGQLQIRTVPAQG